MKLARYENGGEPRIGKVVDDAIIDLSGILPGIGGSMRALLNDLDAHIEDIHQVTGPTIPLSSIRLLTPIDDPQKFLAIGMNYEGHAREAEEKGFERPKDQSWFNKQVSCIAGPNDPIIMPTVSDMLDYECELGYVIGKRCRNVKAADALHYIAGYLVANDVSVRDWQWRSATTTIGKSFDTHGPLGPWITFTDEVASPRGLGIRTYINGEERQNGVTDEMIYGVEAQIEHLTTVMTLEPGDIIITGTPSGCGAATGRYLKVGDVVRVEIDHLGYIENRVEAA